LVCRIAKSSALAESILKKDPHALHYFKIGPDFWAPDLRTHARKSDEVISHANTFEHYQIVRSCTGRQLVPLLSEDIVGEFLAYLRCEFFLYDADGPFFGRRLGKLALFSRHIDAAEDLDVAAVNQLKIDLPSHKFPLRMRDIR